MTKAVVVSMQIFLYPERSRKVSTLEKTEIKSACFRNHIVSRITEKFIGRNIELFANQRYAVIARFFASQKPLSDCGLVYSERVG